MNESDDYKRGYEDGSNDYAKTLAALERPRPAPPDATKRGLTYERQGGHVVVGEPRPLSPNANMDAGAALPAEHAPPDAGIIEAAAMRVIGYWGIDEPMAHHLVEARKIACAVAETVLRGVSAGTGAAPPDHLCNYEGFGALGDVCPACEAKEGQKAQIEAAARALWKMGNARIGERPWEAVCAHYIAEATAALEAAYGVLRGGASPPPPSAPTP